MNESSGNEINTPSHFSDYSTYSDAASIHNVEFSDSSSEFVTSDDDVETEAYAGLKAIITMSRARRLGLEFCSDTTLIGTSFLAVLLRLNWVILRGPVHQGELEVSSRRELPPVALYDIPLILAESLTQESSTL